ncbi:MAG: hypothetical protein SGARI_004267, partial [Bacillariaceae sp.]
MKLSLALLWTTILVFSSQQPVVKGMPILENEDDKPSAGHGQANPLMHFVADSLAVGDERRNLADSDTFEWSQFFSMRPSGNGGNAILVRIFAAAEMDASSMRHELEATASFVATSKCSATTCWGWLDLDALDAVENLESVRSIWPETASFGAFGRDRSLDNKNDDSENNRRRQLLDAATEPVISQAVQALQVDKVRAKYSEMNVSGKGIKIGVLSDSFDFYGGGEAAGIASGNLPASGVTV